MASYPNQIKNMKPLKKALLLALLPLHLFAQNIALQADSLLSAFHQQDLFTGTVLIAQKGNPVFSKSYGKANRKQKISNTATTTFRIGSISKSFTAVIILQLQEEGLLQTSDLLSKYFPKFPNADSITIAHLLSNTSGIKDFIDIKGLYPWFQFKNYKEIIPHISKEPLLFRPGKQFNYSSSNFLLLCAISEQVSGKKYEQLLKEKIFKKLDMRNTGIDDPNRKDANKAIGYEASITDFYVPSSSINIGILAGAGGMYSTAPDLLKFMSGLTRHQLLNTANTKLLFTPNKGNYGFGWEITTLNNQQIIGHSGAIDGFKANLLYFPASETTIAVLSNYADIQSFELYEGLKRMAVKLPFDLPQPHTFIAISEQDLSRYVGEYRINEDIKLNLYLNKGKLVANIAGEDGLVLYPETKDSFYLRGKNAVIKLLRDDAGRVNAVQVIKGTRASTWKRQVTN